MWTCLKPKKVSVSSGFFLLMGILIYLDDGTGLLPWVVLSAFVHEMGHIIVSLLFGGQVETLGLSAVGAELRFAYRRPLSYGRESLIALAGPAANVLLGMLAYAFNSYILASASFGLGAFNLLPILPLDGGNVLFNFISEWFAPNTADCVLSITAGVLIGLLVGVGLILALHYANIMLLIVSGWLLLGMIRKKSNFLQN